MCLFVDSVKVSQSPVAALVDAIKQAFAQCCVDVPVVTGQRPLVTSRQKDDTQIKTLVRKLCLAHTVLLAFPAALTGRLPKISKVANLDLPSRTCVCGALTTSSTLGVRPSFYKTVCFLFQAY